MMADNKKDFWKFIWTLLSVFGCVGILMIIMDPFYQYHKPWLGMPVILDNAVYQTPGAAENLEYRDVIIGTSMTENFHTKWFDEELGWDTVKLSYSGARSDDLRAIFHSVFSGKEPVEHVFMDINDYQLTSASWTSYVERPQYLYDNNLMNDYRYIYSRDTLSIGWERVLDALQGVEDNVDTAYTWEEAELFGAEITLNTARDTREQLLAGQEVAEPLEQRLVTCQDNLNNIIPFIEEHPETEFIIFLPPYSMLYWEQKKLQNDLEDILEIYKYAINCLLEYENVSVYYFQNEQEIITNINNYRDTCHHRPQINRYIFDCIKNKENRVTQENLDGVILAMYEFADQYIYDIYWE